MFFRCTAVESPALQENEPSTEQVAQRQANVMTRLSKRIDGDLKAKIALRDALAQWSSKKGTHLGQLVARARA